MYQFHQYISKSNINISIKGAVLAIEILNIGEGIPLEIQPFLLNESVTDNKALNFDGTGMGLAICMNFAKLMGGGIIFTTTPGQMQETVFIFFIPLKPLDTDLNNTLKNEGVNGNGNEIGNENGNQVN